jgi:hypothetical protein
VGNIIFLAKVVLVAVLPRFLEGSVVANMESESKLL